MLKFSREGIYNIVATKYENDNLTINIGFIGEFPPKKFFIINKFKHNKENDLLFKELFINFISKNKDENFRDFFSLNDHFCAIFKYEEHQNLDYKYNKNNCITNFETRVQIFELICIKIKTCLINNLPILIIMSMLDPKNISIDNENQVFFNLDFRLINIYENEKNKFEENKNKYIIKKISYIFKKIFEVELSSKYNRVMQIIYKKGSLGLYKSLEEFVIDIKNNIKEAGISSLFEYIKYQINIRKYLIPKIINIVLIPSILIISVFLIFNKMKSLNQGTIQGESVTIGEITYSGGKDESAKSVDLDNSGSANIELNQPKKNISIPQNADIEYTDYIVKQGDTPSSIAEEQYGDKSYGSAITSFNGATGYLVPGSILKLPSKSIVIKNQST